MTTENKPSATADSNSLLNLKGVGPQLADKLQRIGILGVQDLLFHLPYRYQDRTRITPLGALRHGMQAVVVGEIRQADIHFGRRRALLTRIADGSGELTMRLFYFNAAQHRALHAGAWLQCFGEARRGPQTLEMVHPEYRVHAERPAMPAEETLTPVYPATEGISPNKMRSLVNQALDRAAGDVPELLPAALCAKLGLLPLRASLDTLHRPPPDADTAALLAGTHPAQQRLALEELMAHHLLLQRIRRRRQAHRAPALEGGADLWERLRANLGFTLTGAQQRVIDEVFHDLRRGTPALRLVQGDVGSGKTVVAAAAALLAVASGCQAAIMAPTELLAEQHRKSFRNWCQPLGVEMEWLSGKMPAAARREALARLESGEARIAVGTHALFQDDVRFDNLGLIVVDEQHRFGVNQRLALRGKGDADGLVPHQLIMSATPIPRSLAMIFYADLDVSSVDELPPGRKPVQTAALPDARRPEVIERIREACAAGRQAYWVCPLIEESESLQAQAATDTAETLTAALPELRVALMHGRMKPKEKDAVMSRFRDGEIDLLVATTVIEVGMDVPNASLMIIENAERLGLAQLHQLRGRVGRGADQASCVLMYQQPLSQIARERLGILRQTSDGFEIARKDLELRGPGELLGTRQTGLQQLKVADLARDRALLPGVEAAARELQRSSPRNIEPLIRRWINRKEAYALV